MGVALTALLPFAQLEGFRPPSLLSDIALARPSFIPFPDIVGIINTPPSVPFLGAKAFAPSAASLLLAGELVSANRGNPEKGAAASFMETDLFSGAGKKGVRTNILLAGGTSPQDIIRHFVATGGDSQFLSQLKNLALRRIREDDLSWRGVLVTLNDVRKRFANADPFYQELTLVMHEILDGADKKGLWENEIRFGRLYVDPPSATMADIQWLAESIQQEQRSGGDGGIFAGVLFDIQRFSSDPVVAREATTKYSKYEDSVRKIISGFAKMSTEQVWSALREAVREGRRQDIILLTHIICDRREGDFVSQIIDLQSVTSFFAMVCNLLILEGFRKQSEQVSLLWEHTKCFIKQHSSQEDEMDHELILRLIAVFSHIGIKAATRLKQIILKKGTPHQRAVLSMPVDEIT